jgi:osmoprotectant transport system substrate-binding protein
MAAAAVIVVIGASAAVIIPRTTSDRPSRTTHQPPPPAPPHLTVGSANFPENALLAEIYAQALEAKGFRVTRRFNLGNRETYFNQIAAGTISVIPEYNGALSSYVSGTGITDTGPTTTSKIDSLLRKTLPGSLKILHPAIAEDKDSVTVTRKTADKYDLRSLTDLADAAPELLMGGPPEFETRHQGLIGLLAKYRVNFKDFRAFRTDDQDAMVQLLKADAIQAADIFTTDPAIKENKFVVLQDPQRLFSAQNVIPLVYRTAVDTTSEDALNDVSAALDTQDLLDMNTRVAHKEDPATVAKDWLAQAGLGG